jgi:hypothetical protein
MASTVLSLHLSCMYWVGLGALSPDLAIPPTGALTAGWGLKELKQQAECLSPQFPTSSQV